MAEINKKGEVMGEFVKTKDAILAMEQVYLSRILELEVNVMTCGGTLELYVSSLEEGEVKDAAVKHLNLVIKSLNNKDYLDRVFNEDMKKKLRSIKLPLEEN